MLATFALIAQGGLPLLAAVAVAAPAEAVETTAAAWASPVLLNSLMLLPSLKSAVDGRKWLSADWTPAVVGNVLATLSSTLTSRSWSACSFEWTCAKLESIEAMWVSRRLSHWGGGMAAAPGSTSMLEARRRALR